ncbi:MAG: ABC transporter permease [Clostridia bacterium]|nr:ABC transporter permease [Clostridia bacterium]NCD01811.1 ABC transporter permease [Clostridia bacterium]
MKRYLSSGIFIAVLLFLWQLAAGRMDAAYILPTPTGILKKLWELREPLFLVHLPATMKVMAIGLAISVALGVGLAVLMDLSPMVEKALYPIVIASQTIPTTAIAPLFVVWFGYGIWSKIVVTILMTFFPITITVFDGFKSVKREMEELLFSYGAGKKDIFLKLKLPAALPHFFSAIKMAVPLSVIGAAIGEWLGAQSGLGYFSRRMMTQLDGAGVFAPILLLSAMAMILVGIISLFENILIKWRKEL